MKKDSFTSWFAFKFHSIPWKAPWIFHNNDFILSVDENEIYDEIVYKMKNFIFFISIS